MALIRFIIFLVFFTGQLAVEAQGIYTEFGQNRVQYKKFIWFVSHAESADFLYNDPQLVSSVHFAEKTISDYLPRIEKLLGYKVSNRPQFLIYGSLSDYKQNNIGYVNPQWQSGGITFIPAEAVPVYHNGDYAAFRVRIQKGLCDFLIREMVYGGTLQDRFERLKSPPLPYWFTEGLSALIAEGWGSEQETAIRDGFGARTFDNFNLLSREKQVLLGRSIWKYIIDKQGIDVISGIMFIARYTHSAEAAISYYSKSQLGVFLDQWKSHCKEEFKNNTGMLLPKGKAEIPQKINRLHISESALNENGRILSLVTHDHGKFSVWFYSSENKKAHRIYVGGQKVFNQINDYSFPKIKWYNNKLYLLTFEKGAYYLLSFNLKGKPLSKLSFDGFPSVNDFAIHPEKDSLIFSGVKNGFSEIYSTSLLGGSYRQLTQDSLFKDNLLWLNNNSIIYSSNTEKNIKNLNRLENNVAVGITFFTSPNRIEAPIMLNDSMLGFLCDYTGLQNAWFTNIYRISEPKGLTNYARSISGQSISGDRSTFSELVKINEKYTIYTGMVNENPESESIVIPRFQYLLKWRNAHLTHALSDDLTGDTSDNQTPDSLQLMDTSASTYSYQTGFPKIDYAEDFVAEESLKPKSMERINLNPIVPDYIVTQIDNKNLGTYLYDNSIPMNVMRNPWLMPYIRISLSDLQRNINLEAGARSSIDLSFTDFHFKGGYYAGRVDHEFSYFRRNRKYDNDPNLYQQYLTQLAEYKVMLPQDERLRYSFTTGLRQDAIVTKITELQAAQIEDKITRYWTNRFEILFDNSISHGLNHIQGSRIKLGLHYLLDPKRSHQLSWAEADMRFYVPLWGSLIFAQRISSAYNLGRNKIGYYLGGVENWTASEQLPENPVMLNPQQINFQSWVCNLRGFYRNARMGHSYVVSNSELRWPILKMIYKRPLTSEFLKHFTLTVFADAGCAFTGQTPADIANPYNTLYLNTPNYAMSITSRRNPWVVGTGYGIRSRILGYFVKFDRAWGWQERQWNKPMQYISLGLDF